MDALIAVIVIGLLLWAFRSIGWWRYFWGSLALLLAGFELAAKLVTGRTLSQQYWDWSLISDWWWAPALGVALGGLGLAGHLVWKRVRR
jgi:hypothetical protein